MTDAELGGSELAEVRDALVKAFRPGDFDMFLRERLDVTRANEVADGPFRRVVGEVLEVAEDGGWLHLLVAEAAAARPLNETLQAVYRRYSAARVDEERRRRVEERRRAEEARFGIGPPLTVQQAGVARASADGGLERKVRDYLPYLDVGLWRQQLFALEARVCRVEVDGRPLGTGFLVGPDAVLTNFHVLMEVIENPALAGGVRLRFDYRVLGDGRRSEGTLVPLHATEWLIDHSPFTADEGAGHPDAALPTPDELDHALVRLDRPFALEPAEAPRGWVPVPTAPSLAPEMPLFILQHPRAEPLKLAIDTRAVLQLNANGTRVRYATNTEAGSSGSPCFDTAWGLVALHHYGDPAFDHAATYNQGVPIQAIRDRLRRAGKDVALGS